MRILVFFHLLRSFSMRILVSISLVELLFNENPRLFICFLTCFWMCFSCLTPKTPHRKIERSTDPNAFYTWGFKRSSTPLEQVLITVL